MTTVVLDEKTAAIPIGEMLRAATDPIIEIRNVSGELLAKMVLARESGDIDYRPLVAQAEGEIDELRRRRTSDRSGDLTTQEMLARLPSHKPE